MEISKVFFLTVANLHGINFKVSRIQSVMKELESSPEYL